MSRYTDAPRTFMPHKSGLRVEVVYRWPPVYSEQQYIDIQPSTADTFASLAFKYYKDPTRYWVIADMNPTVPFPDDLSFGTSIHIPTT